MIKNDRQQQLQRFRNADQEWSQDLKSQQEPDYRHLGDRRWSDDKRGNWWETERSKRQGYTREQRRFYQGGRYTGKGPRSYQRSDDRILEDMNDRLYDDPYLDASDIEVSVSNGEIILTGTVEDRAEKRRAEDLGESVSGAKNVENRLRVRKQDDGPERKY